MAVKLFTPPTLPARGYSQVCEVTTGKLILFAGQVPHDVNDKLVGAGDFDAQVEQVFQNLGRALEAVGGSFKNLVKINNYCVETVSYEVRANYRTIRDRFVDTTNPPVSTFIYVPRLAQPIVVEGFLVRPLAGVGAARNIFAAVRAGAQDDPVLAVTLDALCEASRAIG